MTLAFPISPGNTVVTGPSGGHQLEPNADGSLPIQGSFSAAPPTDTFGNAANITAATTFAGVPTVSQLAANSSVLLANPGAQATFIAEIAVASAFVGTLSFYGLEPDGATLQLIGTHLRGVGTTAMSIAISTAVALNQTWMGSAVNFKTIYVVCTAFTSGSVSVQLGLSAAPYAMVILNTINALITNANANGQATMLNSAPVAPASDYIGPIKPNNLSIAGNTSTTVNGANTDLFAWIDTSGYNDFSVQLTGTWTMTLTIQFSNDQVNPVSGLADAINSINANTPSTLISANGIYSGRIKARYMRIRATSWTSNASAIGTLWLSSIPVANNLITQMSTPQVTTSGGTTSDYHLVSAATTNAANIKSSAGQIYGYDIGNSGASDAWVKLYNKASSPTVGTDTPYRVLYLPKGTARSFHSSTGVKLGTGISIAVTGGAADNDTTAVAASQVTVEVDYN